MLARWLCIVASLLALASWHPETTASLLPHSFSAASTAVAAPQSLDLRLPLQQNSVRFAVVGDTGTGDQPEFEVAQEMERYRARVGFDFDIMLGDNIYGGHKPQDFARKFEQPFKPLLDAGVKFYASLGNHDDPNDERLYKPFNMGGERYYVFKKGDVAFFVLDSNYFDPTQLSWLTQNLQQSNAKWKIAYFHHPLYNNGRNHGPDLDLRAQLVPLFRKYAVNVVFSGHEHVYEHIRPQDNIYYFVLGNSAKLMDHDFGDTPDASKTFDTDRAFMLVEVAGDQLYFQTIARNGVTIDFGTISRQSSISGAP